MMCGRWGLFCNPRVFWVTLETILYEQLYPSRTHPKFCSEYTFLTAIHMNNTFQEGDKAFMTQPTFSATLFLEIKDSVFS